MPLTGVATADGELQKEQKRILYALSQKGRGRKSKRRRKSHWMKKQIGGGDNLDFLHSIGITPGDPDAHFGINGFDLSGFPVKENFRFTDLPTQREINGQGLGLVGTLVGTALAAYLANRYAKRRKSKT